MHIASYIIGTSKNRGVGEVNGTLLLVVGDDELTQVLLLLKDLRQQPSPEVRARSLVIRTYLAPREPFPDVRFLRLPLVNETRHLPDSAEQTLKEHGVAKLRTLVVFSGLKRFQEVA